MTLEQFKNQGWGPNMRCDYRYGGNSYQIAAIDFEESLVGLKDPLNDDKIPWVRCENITLNQISPGND